MVGRLGGGGCVWSSVGELVGWLVGWLVGGLAASFSWFRLARELEWL